MRIVITGTPGTGKTEVAKKLSKLLGLKLLDTRPVLEKAKIGYDEKRKTDIIDERKFGALLDEIKGDFIAEGHLTHFAKKVDLCVVLTCNAKELRRRLEERGWKKEKIDENVKSELVKICLGEAMDMKHEILVVDTSEKRAEEVAKEVANHVKNRLK